MAALRLALATGLATSHRVLRWMPCGAWCAYGVGEEVVRCRLNDLSISTAQSEAHQALERGRVRCTLLRQMTGLDRPKAASLASELLADPVPRRSIARLRGRRGLPPTAAGASPGPGGLPLSPDRVVAWSPLLPLLGVILGGQKPAKIRPILGRIFPDFCPPAVQRPGGVGGLRPLP